MNFSNAINLLASITTIMSFILELILLRKKSENYSTTQQILNIESNKNNKSYIFTKNYYILLQNTPLKKTNTTYDISDFIIFLVLGLIAVHYYLINQTYIISILIISCIIGLFINISGSALIYKRKYIRDYFIYFNTLKWLPILFLIHLIKNPIFKPQNLQIIEKLYINKINILENYFNYPFESIYLLFHILGVFFLASLILTNIISVLKLTYKLLRDIPYNNKFTFELKYYIASIIFIFLLISGSLYNILTYIIKFK